MLSGGKASIPRYHDLAAGFDKPPKPERTADDIINDISTKLEELGRS